MNDPIRILLAFLLDARPAPIAQRLDDGKGAAPMHKVVCSDCQGEGFKGRRLQPCLRCGGITDPRRNGRGWLWVDAYTEREVGTEDTTLVDHSYEVVCDSCGGDGAHRNGHRCVYCQGTGRRRVAATREAQRGIVADRSESYQVALAAGRCSGHAGLWRNGSFAALESALFSLPAHQLRLVWRVCVSVELDEQALPDAERELLTRSLRILRYEVEKSDGYVRVPRVCRDWYRTRRVKSWGQGRDADRNVQILGLLDEGWTQQQVADKMGVHRSTVSRIAASVSSDLTNETIASSLTA